METVSVVVPCFRGQDSLDSLVDELAQLSSSSITPQRVHWRVLEIILVWDGGEAQLAKRIRHLAHENDLVRPIYLSRNFGQHPATLAGFSISAGDWVVTMDEDGQHSGSDIAILLDAAMESDALLCYSREPSRSKSRRTRAYFSKTAKEVASSVLRVNQAPFFQSFRLIKGHIARQVAQKIGPGVYLDIALSWFVDNPAVAEVRPNHRRGDKSSYTFPMLISHFWRLFLSVGPATTRVISFVGLVAAAGGVVLGIFLSLQATAGAPVPPGWTSQIVLTLVFSGLTLVLLGLIAEYLGQIQKSSMGRPTYVIANNSVPEAAENGRE